MRGAEVRKLGSGLWMVLQGQNGGQVGRSIRYSERLAKAGIEPSVDSVGYSYDNALAETIHGPLQGRGDPSTLPLAQRGAVEFATLEWVDWFNHRRLLEPIDNLPPAEAEARYHAQTESLAVAM